LSRAWEQEQEEEEKEEEQVVVVVVGLIKDGGWRMSLECMIAYGLWMWCRGSVRV